MTAKRSGQASTDDPARSSKEKALRVAHWALEKKAMDTRILHVGPLTTIAEYFLICSGRSVRQTRAIAQQIQTRAKAAGILPLGVEGEEEGSWILLDYDDIVVHVFHEPTRELFSLEKLWSDASPLIDPGLAREQAAVEYREGEEDEDWEV
jgi:ribosome-associated protein